MKQYVYTERQLGLEHFSDGILRLDCETTRDPDEADVFVCPEPLFKFVEFYQLGRIPHMSKYQNRHVFLDLSEHFTTYEHCECIFIRAALTNKMLKAGPNSIAWPWPVDDFADCIAPPPGPYGFTHSISFHGWGSNLARRVAAKSCNTIPGADITVHPNFFGYQSTEFQAERRLAYRNSMRQSRVCLTVESIPGVIPYRFYEAMSAGRTQLYVGSDYNLPFADEIPYDKFISRLPTDHADQAGEYAQDWLKRCTEAQLIEKGLEARHYWEKYLWRDNWIQMLTYAVEKKLKSYV